VFDRVQFNFYVLPDSKVCYIPFHKIERDHNMARLDDYDLGKLFIYKV
jgi:hypothetical protein